MNAVIFGAGKIARGFVAQLLFRTGADITFVEVNQGLRDALNVSGKYYVNVMGNESQSQWITGYRCVALDDACGIAEALNKADIAFTSVGGKNLPALGEAIASAYEKAMPDIAGHCLNIITCENWKDPAAELTEIIKGSIKDQKAAAAFAAGVSIAESVVMRSAVEPTAEVLKIDKNAVSVHNFWELPVDASKIIGARVQFEGVKYLEDFHGFLRQKFFTFNGGNSTIAYIGSLKGIDDLASAANDSEVTGYLDAVYSEINPALSKELGIDIEAQKAFSEKAKRKYQDRNVIDHTERHARDPLRKLGPEDRIVGVARMIESQGIEPAAMSATLAAAICYNTANEADPSAEELKRMRREEGIPAVLKKICGIDPDERLAVLAMEHIEEFRKKGWVKL